MISIYFYETPEGIEAAQAAAKKLRALGKKVRLTNAAFFNETQLERVDAVVALDCPQVVEGYEKRKEAMALAEARGDVRQFAGIPKFRIVTDPDDLIERVESNPDDDVDDDEFGKMTRDMLMDYAESMLGMKLPANMRKSEMVSTIRANMKTESTTQGEQHE